MCQVLPFLIARSPGFVNCWIDGVGSARASVDAGGRIVYEVRGVTGAVMRAVAAADPEKQEPERPNLYVVR